ncbi:CPBP family intramembrane glutamic endopeptidase [Pontibacter silvestris]|uniref:CPBP family intramembrane glutamic endopeptidase n=1 Tax=Pontibacter silvestris TaxID=2305183 RepID=A0ABW4WWU8_9BACT|nr:CPBP family intramembrane glutamic endopeptidase [Pontibacter silvestris]MCC9136616.1 CPBP family intramembrane metalloprotease [Pontibacter silvestris]
MKGFISKDIHPFLVFLLLIVLMSGGYFVASFVYSLLVNWIFDISIYQLLDVVENPSEYPNGPDAMLLFQAIVSFFSFIVAPVYLLRIMGFNLNNYLNWKITPGLGLVLLSGLLIVIIMPFNSAVIDWNANLQFPESMKGFEQWARSEEDRLAELTKLIANFGTLPRFLLGLVVFAAIPAIGEELVFRGVMQRQLHRWFGNMHVAVWAAALIFAAIHVQFFGFVPRAILGALFGYLYFWSGRIIIPMVAHFVNNGFTVFLLYLQQSGAIDADVESTEAMPWYSVILSLVLSAAILYYLYQRFLDQPLRPESVAEVEVPDVESSENG